MRSFTAASKEYCQYGLKKAKPRHGHIVIGPARLIHQIGEDSYRFTHAVAGFRPDEFEFVAQQNLFTVSDRRIEEDEGGEYLHRDIAARFFERRFPLADFTETIDATFKDGLVSVDLSCVVPKAMKPRRLEIAESNKATEQLKRQPMDRRRWPDLTDHLACRLASKAGRSSAILSTLVRQAPTKKAGEAEVWRRMVEAALRELGA